MGLSQYQRVVFEGVVDEGRDWGRGTSGVRPCVGLACACALGRAKLETLIWAAYWPLPLG